MSYIDIPLSMEVWSRLIARIVEPACNLQESEDYKRDASLCVMNAGALPASLGTVMCLSANIQ